MYTFGLCHVVVLPYSPTGKYPLSICIGNRRHSHGFSHRNDHDRFLYAGYLLDYRYPSGRHSLLLDSRVHLLGIQTTPIFPLFQKNELESEEDIIHKKWGRNFISVPVYNFYDPFYKSSIELSRSRRLFTPSL